MLTRLHGRVNVPGAMVLLAIGAGWQLLVGLRVLDLDYLPAPSEIASALADLAREDRVLTDILHTTGVVIEGWLIALICGGVFGILMGLSSRVRMFSMASVDVLRSLPVVAFIPVVLLLAGPTRNAEVMVAAYAALWPILINAFGGVVQVHPRLFEVAQTFQLSRIATIRKVVLPAAVPAVLVGARLSLGIAFVVTIVAEMIGNPAGLGYGLVLYQFALRPDAMWAYVAVIGALGLLLNALLVGISRMAPTPADRPVRVA